MKCRDCHFFIGQNGDAGLCVSDKIERVCASGGCTGLPFRRVFGNAKACGAFKKS